MSDFLSIPMTAAMKSAVVKAARRLGLHYSAFGRMMVLEKTDYDPETDDELDSDEAAFTVALRKAFRKATPETRNQIAKSLGLELP